MITKEKLEELIREETIIYYIWYTKYAPYMRISECKLNNKMYVDDDILCLEDCDDGEILYLNDIFETIEDAEWHREFGCIERTERLNITDWQKFKNRDENFGFTVEDYSYKCFTDGIEIELVEFWGQGGRSLFKAPLTKENYTIACRKAKELFLGEKK